MKNWIQDDCIVEVTAPYNVASGAGLLVGALFGVAEKAANSGDLVNIATEGVAWLPKATGAISQGALVYWDNTAKNVTTTSSGNTLIGKATLAALSGDALASVLFR